MDIKTHAVFTFTVELDFLELEAMADLFDAALRFRGSLESVLDEDTLVRRIKGIPGEELDEIGEAIAKTFSNAVDAITDCGLEEP